MKALIVIAMLFVFGAAAQAKLTPRDSIAPAPSALAAELAPYSGPIGAMLEANYFRAKAANFGGTRQCSLHSYFSTQPFRLARSCD
jgi:hypothetical protein